jgi:hypothetical protein
MFRRQVTEATSARTSVTLGYLLDEWLAGHQVEETTRTSYRVAIENFLKPAVGDTSLSRLAQLGARPFEQLYAELRVCRRRCKGRTFLEHRTQRDHVCDKRCAPHQCRPLSVSSVRECQAVLSGALSAALRCGWIAVNPLETVKRPRQQHPSPILLRPMRRPGSSVRHGSRTWTGAPLSGLGTPRPVRGLADHAPRSPRWSNPSRTTTTRPHPQRRRCLFCTICGSTLPSRSRGTSITTSPTASEITVLTRVPLRTFPDSRPTSMRFFSWPRWSVISSPSAVSNTFLVNSFNSPFGPVSATPAAEPQRPWPPQRPAPATADALSWSRSSVDS